MNTFGHNPPSLMGTDLEKLRQNGHIVVALIGLPHIQIAVSLFLGGGAAGWDRKARGWIMGKKTNRAVVFSVSLRKGCYRHIRVSADDTLEDLADTILWAFHFDNDHAHAFFMNNRIWDDADCYYMAEVDEDEEFRHTCDYTLQQIGLQKDDLFKFVFDFGDEWAFQCKVLRIEDAPTKDAELIRAVGQPPEQYPAYEYDEE